MTDEQYEEWVNDMPEWKQWLFLATCLSPFVGAFVMIVLGFAGVVK